MNKLLLSSVAMVVALASEATVSINWNSPNNSIKDDTSANAPSTWITQLIWSPDNIASPIDMSNPFVPTLASGEQVLLAQQLNLSSINGRIVSGQTNYADSYATGFVYTRVFNTNYNGGSPGTPTKYGESALISGPLLVLDADPTNGSEILTHSPSSIIVNQSIVAVPEPSTYALALVGIVAALWRRRVKA